MTSSIRPSAVLAISAAGMTTTALISAVIPDILDDFGQPDHGAGHIVASAALPAIVASPMLGVLADRHGRIRVVRPCLIAFGVLGLLSGLAPSYGIFLGLRFLQGFPAAGLITLAIVIISDQWGGRDRGKMLGRNAAVLTGSLAVFPLVSGLLAELAGWRAVCFAYSLALLVPRAVPAEAARAPSPFSTFGVELRSAGVVAFTGRIPWVLFAGIAAFALVFGWNVTLLPIHAEQVLGMAPVPRGALVAAGAVTATLTALTLGGRTSQARTGFVVLVAALLFAGGWGIVALASSMVAVVAAGIALTGVSQGILFPALQGAIADEAPPAQRGSALSLWGSAVRIGQTVGSVVMGLLLAQLATSTSFAVGAGFTATAAVALTAGLLVANRAGPDAHDCAR